MSEVRLVNLLFSLLFQARNMVRHSYNSSTIAMRFTLVSNMTASAKMQLPRERTESSCRGIFSEQLRAFFRFLSNILFSSQSHLSHLNQLFSKVALRLASCAVPGCDWVDLCALDIAEECLLSVKAFSAPEIVPSVSKLEVCKKLGRGTAGTVDPN